MDAPRLPTTEADLADWAVYADWLLQRGERLGELIAADLAVPALATREQIAPLHALAREVCRDRVKTPIAWMLGHARTLTVRSSPGAYDARKPAPVASAVDFLRTPVAQRIDTLYTDAVVWGDESAWTRLVAALPASVATVVFLFDTYETARTDMAVLVGALPRSVRRLENIRINGTTAAAIDDRFDVVDLGPRSIHHRAEDLIVARLAATRTVRLQLNAGGIHDLPAERFVFAGPGDAALLGRQRVNLLRQEPLLGLQRRFGYVGVRAQLARALPEHVGWGVVRRPQRWTFRGSSEEDSTPVRHNGRLVGDEVVELHEGDRLGFGGGGDVDERTFVTTDVDAACRRALGV